MVASPILVIPGPEAPSTGGPPSTSATVLPPVEEMTYTSMGSPFDGATYSSMANLFASGDGFSPPVGGLGHVVTVNHTLHGGKRWDYVVGVVSVPQGKVTLEVRDPANSTYPAVPILLQSVAAAGSDSVTVDLRSLDSEDHIQLEFSFILDHRGNSRSPPVLESWVVGDSDLDLWHDPFWDIGREDSRGDLALGRGVCEPVNTHVGGGLMGDYYDSRDFTNHAFQRLDQTIDFDWGNNDPGGGMGSNTFSIRWEGKIMIPADDTYDFHLTCDDGGRLWVGGDQLIDEWYDQSPTEHTGSKLLTAGLHDIRIDYYENRGGASCELRWSSSTITKTILPHTALWGRESSNVLVSEEVQVPNGQVWDLLFFETDGTAGFVRYDLFDALNDVPISGYQCLTAPVLDLSSLSAGLYPRINLRARWDSGDPAISPGLIMWGIKSQPERTWRSEFLTDLKIVGMVGLTRETGVVVREGTSTHTSLIAFAESYDGHSTLVDSTVMKGEYWKMGLPTVNATDVALGDLDGDGLDDVLYSHGQVGMNATAHRATAGGYGTAPTWSFDYDAQSRDVSFFSHLVTGDLDGDGDTDVVLVAHNTSVPTTSPDVINLYFNDGSSFNATPDRTISTGAEPISSISTGDIDGDGKEDIAVGHGGDDGFAGVLYASDDWRFIEDQRWVNHPVLTVHVGDLNGDAYDDLFIGADLSKIPRPNNNVFFGESSGLDDDPTFTFSKAPAFAATYANQWFERTLDDSAIRRIDISTLSVASPASICTLTRRRRAPRSTWLTRPDPGAAITIRG